VGPITILSKSGSQAEKGWEALGYMLEYVKTTDLMSQVDNKITCIGIDSIPL